MALTSLIRHVEVLDTSVTTGAGLTGKVYSDFTAAYCVDGGTLVSLTTETITTLGTYQAPTSSAHIRIKELNSADPTKGMYEVHFHNTQLATGTKLWLYMSVTGGKAQRLELDLVDVKPVNLIQLGSSSQSATDLKDFADTGYDPVTHKVAEVAALTGHTVQTGDSYTIVNSGTHGNAALKTLIDAVDNFVDTEIGDIQSRLPASLVGGYMDCRVALIAAGAINAAAIATDAIDADALAASALEEIATYSTADLLAYDTGFISPGETVGAGIKYGGIPIGVMTVIGTPTTTSIQVDAGSSFDNYYRNSQLFVLPSGSYSGQISPIASYAGATRTFAFDEAFIVAPQVGDKVMVIPRHVHTNTEIASAVTADMDSNSTKLAAIVADTNELQTDWANGGRLDLILDAMASQSSVDALAAYVDTEMAAVLEDTGTTIPAQIAALFTTALTESYRADGATGTPAEILYELLALNGEFAITTTTKQHKKLDGTTDAFASTLNDATNPTAITRA